MFRLAKEYKLHLLYKSEFHEVFREHQEIPEFEQLMQRMKVVDKDGSSSMDEDQWEAASEQFSFVVVDTWKILTFTLRYLHCIRI